MHRQGDPVIILVADDDEDDRFLMQAALTESRLANSLRFVVDGEELLEYLRREKAYAAPDAAPRPGLILLDLNMPKKDGREALREIKNDPELRHIPVVILTTSDDEIDVNTTYSIGANSYITKPVTFKGLVSVIEQLGKYWFELVELPSTRALLH